MPIKPIYIVGAGGHASVVLDAMLASDSDLPVQVVDADPNPVGRKLLGKPVNIFVGQDICSSRFHVAIGHNASRAGLHLELVAFGGEPHNVVHPRACISPHATLAGGCFVAAQAIIAPGVVVGEGCIINHGAVIDHDCDIGAFCHVAPNATLGGNVKLGERVFVGAGAVILPGLKIGNGAVIGAGAAVVRDVLPNAAVMGVPAKDRKKD